MSALMIVVMALGVAQLVALTSLRAVRRKLGALPLDVWAVVNTERSAVDAQALDRLREAAALAEGIRSYHQQLEAVLITERNDADLRARVVERASRDASIALDAASTLVAEARALVDGLVAHAGDPRERPTMEPKRRPSPAVAPPGSAAPMSPEPAQIAAGLGTRPHATPRRTLLGIRPPPPSAVEEGDRPSEDELTCVVDRPPAVQLGTAKTLMSMPSVTAPRTKEGAS